MFFLFTIAKIIMGRNKININDKVMPNSFYATRNQLKLIGGGNIKKGWRILKAMHKENIVRAVEGIDNIN